MHRIRLAILLFLCVSAAGCQPVPGVLLDAEAIVMEHPDSAARLLEGVPAPEKRLSRRNYAHYALVLTQARWLAGENMIDDTLSDVALDYYRTHTDDFAAAHKAYYYAAKIAHQRRQPEVAMTLLLKSRDMLPPKGEWRRHYVVETWLGVFCGQQHLFEEKIRHAQQAYAYADSMERYDWMCISLGDMAHAYMGLDNYDSMEYYAIKALRLAEEKGITENTSPKWAMLIESALKRKEYRKAEEYWEKGFGHAPAWTRYSWLSTKADICNRTGRYDTALELTDSSRRMCADTTHLTSRALWALNTSNAWEGKGDAARSLEALKQYIRLKDSIDEKVHSAEVLNIRKLWRYEQLKTQNAALQSQKQHRERIVYETILICAALMLLGAWLGLAHVAPRQIAGIRPAKAHPAAGKRTRRHAAQGGTPAHDLFPPAQQPFHRAGPAGRGEQEMPHVGRRLEDDLHPCRRRIRQFHGPSPRAIPGAERGGHPLLLYGAHAPVAGRNRERRLSGKGFGEKTAEAHPHREAGFREGFDAGGDPLAAVKYTPGCRPRRMETAGGQSVEKRPVHCDIPLQTSGNSRGAFNFAHETSPAIRLPQQTRRDIRQDLLIPNS